MNFITKFLNIDFTKRVPTKGPYNIVDTNTHKILYSNIDEDNAINLYLFHQFNGQSVVMVSI